MTPEARHLVKMRGRKKRMEERKRKTADRMKRFEAWLRETHRAVAQIQQSAHLAARRPGSLYDMTECKHGRLASSCFTCWGENQKSPSQPDLLG